MSEGGQAVGVDQDTAALFQGALRRAGQVVHAQLGIRPHGHGRVGPLVRLAQKNHGTAHAGKPQALQRQPALAESLGRGGFRKAAPNQILRLNHPLLEGCSYGVKTGLSCF